jgi:bla regulator protein BlaR1
MKLIFALELLGVMTHLAAAPPTFEVAVIKPNKTGAGNRGFRRAAPGELNALNDSLKMLIAYAYDVRDYQIEGGPNWIDSESYDILAKSEAGADDDLKTNVERTARLRLRVQALLADRFQLKLHRTTKDLPMFALVVAKNGSKLKASTSTRSESVSNGHHLSCVKVTMEAFCKTMLQGELGRRVSDKTGLAGEFDFTMDWAPDEGSRRTPAEEAGVASTPGREGPSFFTALQEQLGLKLEPQKGPVEVLVVDSAAFPSEN